MKKRKIDPVKEKLFHTRIRIGAAAPEAFDVRAWDEAEAVDVAIRELLADVFDGRGYGPVRLGATITAEIARVAL